MEIKGSPTRLSGAISGSVGEWIFWTATRLNQHLTPKADQEWAEFGALRRSVILSSFRQQTLDSILPDATSRARR